MTLSESKAISMKVMGIFGWSGSGKTELLTKLVPEFKRRGFTVSTMKHTHHDFDMDTPGKDSYRHREAGAEEVMVCSSQRWVLMHELRGAPEPDMGSLISRMTPVDLLLIEGFKENSYEKMEVYRPSTGKEMISVTDESVVALISDEKIDGLSVPLLDLNNVGEVADFIVKYLDLKTSG
jgi:molybdopterin-guanine dinucleotide biosynthesis protein B